MKAITINFAILVSVTFKVHTATAVNPWPRGYFSLLQTSDGCPTGMSSGWRLQDNEDTNNENHWMLPDIGSCLNIGLGRNLKTYYCTKTTRDGVSSWPSGKYCIAKYGSSCPSGFFSGYIHWDDEDSNNINSLMHPVPSGRYDRNTEIDFCCCSDGSHNNPINLPSTQPFALYRYQGRCQKVRGMKDPIELFVHYDDEDSSNANRCSGNHPGGSCIRNHELYFCYYTPSSINKCNSNPCQNGGTCTQLNFTCAGYECNCGSSYRGTNCEHLYGNLRIKARYGRNLPDSDPWLNDSDPYMQIIAIDEKGHSLTKRSSYASGDHNPDWNEWLEFGNCAWKRFKVRVYDDDVDADDPLSSQRTWTLSLHESRSSLRLDCNRGYVVFDYEFL